MRNLDKFVGCIVVRTKPMRSGAHYFDRSYMSYPIKIEAVACGIVYVRCSPVSKVSILSADFDDGNWETIHPDFLHHTWGEKP